MHQGLLASPKEPPEQLSRVGRRSGHDTTLASNDGTRRAGHGADGKMPRGDLASGRGAPMELSLTTRSVSGYMVLEVGGEIDVYTAPRLRERLTEMIGAGHKHIVADLGRV